MSTCYSDFVDSKYCNDSNTLSIYNPNGGDGTDVLFQWLGGWNPARANIETYTQVTGIQSKGDYDGIPNSHVPDNDCCIVGGTVVGDTCTVGIADFGRITVESEPIKPYGTGLKNCERDPITMISDPVTGLVTNVDNDFDWAKAKMTHVMVNERKARFFRGIGPASVNGIANPNNPTGIQDHWGLIPYMDGSAEAAGQYGCNQSVNVLDFGGNPVCSNEELENITLNGSPVTGVYNLNRYLTQYFRSIRKEFNRLGLSGTAGVNQGDFALIIPDELIDCYTKCSACDIICNCDYTRIDGYEARAEQLRLMGETPVGYGKTRFDQLEVPFINANPFDYQTGRQVLDNGDGTYDLMLIWRGSGSRRFWELQYNPLDRGADPMNNDYMITDGGMFALNRMQRDGSVCRTYGLETQWRVKNIAPCLQLYIKNVSCDTWVDVSCRPDFTPVDTCVEHCES